jgi:putative PIN family toxin of toxin-antitoxin system
MIARVVFDPSTLIGATLSIGSKPHRALMLALEFCVLCTSEELIAELAEVLARNYFVRHLSQADRENFVDLIRNKAEIYQVSQATLSALNPPCRDADDNFILALALACKADAIVSSDQDLLVLNPWNGIAVLTSAEFIATAEI